MIKRITIALIWFFAISMPLFAVEVRIPTDHWGDDYNVTLKEQTSNTRVRGDENTLFSTINLVNEYLWWSFGAICAGVVIYGGYQLITANGDKNAMKKGQRAFIWSWIGLGIAMLSYALVKFIVNLL